MTLGAVVGTFLLDIGTGSGGLLPFAHQSFIPAWFVVIFLIFAIVQLFAINSLDMYSSGITLQAIGLPVKRYHAVLIDCVIALVSPCTPSSARPSRRTSRTSSTS